MELIKIEPTYKSPMVELNPEGSMTIRGRSIIEDPITFYKRILDWIPKCKSKSFSIEVQFEYLNTFSTGVFLNLLKKIKYYYNSNNLTISWYYEEDDDDMLELGQNIESLIDVSVNFYETSEKVS